MSNYTKTTDFAAKDSLATGNANKVVSGTEIDDEFDNIASAIVTKYDNTNLASQAQAEGLTLDTVLLTPHSLNDVLVANAGVLSDLQAFADPLSDRLFGWDASGLAAVGFTLGTGLSFNGTAVELESGLSALSQLAKTDGNILVGNGTTWVAESGATARASLGLAIGTDVQAHDAGLDAIAALAVTNGNFIVGNGATWVAESGATVRNSLSLGTANAVEFQTVSIGSTDTTLSRDAAGQIAVEGAAVFTHNDTALTSAKIFVSTAGPSGGSNGDIWLEYQ